MVASGNLKTFSLIQLKSIFPSKDNVLQNFPAKKPKKWEVLLEVGLQFYGFNRNSLPFTPWTTHTTCSSLTVTPWTTHSTEAFIVPSAAAADRRLGGFMVSVPF